MNDEIKYDDDINPEWVAKFKHVKYPEKAKQTPLTDEQMVTVYSSIYGAGTERENLIEMGRAVELAHGIGEKE